MRTRNFLCSAEMDFEADSAEEALALMAQAMRQGDVEIIVTELDENGEPV